MQCDERVFLVSKANVHLNAPESLLAMLFPEDDGSVAVPPAQLPLQRNDTHPLHPVVFDRSPKYVEPLLQFLRTGELVIPNDVPVHGVLLEARYFNVQRVMALLDGMTGPYSLTNDEEKGAGAKARSRWMTRREVERMLLTVAPGTRIRCCGLNLEGLDFSDLDLSFVDFSRCCLNGAVFERADLHHANFNMASAQRCNFTGAVMASAQCAEADFSDSNMSKVDGKYGNFSRSNFRRCSFDCADLSFANMEGSDLTASLLTGTALKNCCFKRAILADIERQGTSLTMGGVLNID